jgi:hypothetical protein
MGAAWALSTHFRIYRVAGRRSNPNNPLTCYSGKVWPFYARPEKIGRGLDFYQKPGGWYEVGANDLSLRKCLETKVDIFR